MADNNEKIVSKLIDDNQDMLEKLRELAKYDKELRQWIRDKGWCPDAG